MKTKGWHQIFVQSVLHVKKIALIFLLIRPTDVFAVLVAVVFSITRFYFFCLSKLQATPFAFSPG